MSPPAAVFVGRLPYERTYLKWECGEQAISFVFVHACPEVFPPSVVSLSLARSADGGGDIHLA